MADTPGQPDGSSRAPTPAAGHQSDLGACVRHCDRITEASGSNLWLVSRALPPPKHRFFTVAYASMRVIDDFVDDEFMTLDPAQRNAARTEALDRVARWAAMAEAAADGKPDPAGENPEISTALAALLGQSTLGAGPWHRLAEALADDIRERALHTWDDFRRYCRGATVAPAEIFLFVLVCREDAGRYQHDPALPLPTYATHMGTFCYLVHICRDLRKDSLAGGQQLVTVPSEILAAHNLDAATLRDDIRSGQTTRARALVADLIARATPLRESVARDLDALRPHLDPRERAILEGLLGVYYRLHDLILDDPGRPLKKVSLLGFEEKLQILKAAGIGAGDMER